jgi:hypothetical protein
VGRQRSLAGVRERETRQRVRERRAMEGERERGRGTTDPGRWIVGTEREMGAGRGK